MQHLKCLVLAGVLAGTATSARVDLPVVDLGYVRQRATVYNDVSDIYTFSNIRYARAPTYERRWKAPEAPLPEREVQDGKNDRICYQAQPWWQVNLLGPWLGAFASNQTAEFYAQFPEEPQPPGNPSFPGLLPEETEDCLFLDLYVPRSVFEKKTYHPAAVMVWIHGGGLVLGSKKADGNFSALVAESVQKNEDPIIIVSINYRLGAFGFLGGPSLRLAGGVSNTGLLDQRFALQWVHDKIMHFGGDTSRITVAGESAGGASIIHQIVSYGGSGPSPVFQRALVQSSGWNPTKTTQHLDLMYGRFLGALNGSSLKGARSRPALDVRNANFLLNEKARWGDLVFGVEADGVFIPKPVPVLLGSGRFHHNISVMSGQNAAEGVIFASPWTRNLTETHAFLSKSLPDTPQDELSYIDSRIYPSPDQSQENAGKFVQRAQEIVAEAGVFCNSVFLADAFARQSYNYVFNVPPAWHATDLPYTFYDGSDPSVNVEVAKAMQRRFLSFITSGDPNHGVQEGSGSWQKYGERAFTAEFSPEAGSQGKDFNVIRNPGDNHRCRDWWGREFYSWKSASRSLVRQLK